MMLYDWDNPFNSALNYDDIDPLYAVTAEDYDKMCSPNLPEIADMDTYVEGRLLGQYKVALKKAIQAGEILLNRSTGIVPYPAAADLTYCWLKRIELAQNDHAEHRGVFFIDAIFVAEIDIFQEADRCTQNTRLGSYQELISSGVKLVKDHVRQWYRIRGQMDLAGHDIDLIQRIMLYSRKDELVGRRLSKYLIPILSVADMDAEAEDFLKRLHLDDSLENCSRVDGKQIASAMGLAVKKARLSRDHHIRAMLYLSGKTVLVYNDDGVEDYIDVEAGTILYDPLACATPGELNKAIIHECIHADHHWLFWALQSEYNTSITFLSCADKRFSGVVLDDLSEKRMLSDNEITCRLFGNSRKSRRSAIEWAEWQARVIAPRVLMPAKQTRKKIEDLLSKRGYSSNNCTVGVIAGIIHDLAGFYGVSWSEAKIRMVELGFAAANGTLNYLDGKYVPAYTTGTGVIEAGTTYDISAHDAENLYKRDPLFKSVVDTGTYLYVEGHYCLNDRRFVCYSFDVPHLTAEARGRVEQCCLLFYKGYVAKSGVYDKGTFHSDDLKTESIAVALASVPLEAIMSFVGNIEERCKNLPRRFGETLAYHRAKCELSQEELAEMLDMSERQIRRLESDEMKRPSQQLIAEIGRVLQLEGCFTSDLMNKAGCPLNRDLPEDMVLLTVISFMYMRTKKECNQVLVSHHCKPLGGKVA